MITRTDHDQYENMAINEKSSAKLINGSGTMSKPHTYPMVNPTYRIIIVLYTISYSVHAI